MKINKLNIKTPGREEVVVEGAGKNAPDSSDDDINLVIVGLGGEANIETVANCMTRLRVIVKDENQVDKHILEKVSKQKGIVTNGKNIQVIIGMGVQSFKEDVCEKLGISE